MVDASVWRARQDQKRALHHAWHVAALANNAFFGKMPRLEALIRDPEDRTPRSGVQTQAAQIAIWQAMADAEGMKARD